MRRIVLLSAIAALACVGSPYPSPPQPPRDATVPIPDRFARARLEMVAAVNADRARYGLGSVALDSLATVVAQGHAREMAAEGYLSHYNTAGLAPYERLAAAGGTGHVLENVFRWQERAGPGFELDDPWDRFDIRTAQAWLMDSPGHRAAILDRHRTAIGVGIAVDPSRAAVYVVQELISASATLSYPGRVLPGGVASVSGRVQTPGARPLMLVVTREPFVRAWAARGDRPPAGSYADGSERALVVPPWAIRWNPDDRSFDLRLPMGRGTEPARWYGILYVAPEATVREAVSARQAETGRGWPAAAFVVEVL